MGEMSVAVAVMAHPARAEFVPELLARLDKPAEVVFDQRQDRWDTGRRSWLALADADTTHGMVVQDDAVTPLDLVAGVEQALPHVKPGSPLCLYAGSRSAMRTQVQRRVRGPVSWLTMPDLRWGVAIVMPIEHIRPVVAHGDKLTEPNYDERISQWYERQHIRVWYPWPSLVDHRDSPSLVEGRRGGRHALRFLGANASVLDFDPAGPAVHLPSIKRRRR